MNKSSRDRLIEQYVDGTMSPGEEARFAAELSADEELRTRVAAEQMIRRAIRDDRSSLPQDHDETRHKVMGALAGLSAPAGAAGLATGGSSGFVGGGLLAKGVAAVVVAAGIVGGVTVFLTPDSADEGGHRSSEGIPERSAPTEVPQPPVVVEPVAPAPVPSVPMTEDSPDGHADIRNAEPLSGETAGTDKANRKNVEAPVERKSVNEHAIVPEVPQPHAESNIMSSDTASSNAVSTSRKPRVLREDSVKLKLKLDVRR